MAQDGVNNNLTSRCQQEAYELLGHKVVNGIVEQNLPPRKTQKY